MYLRQEVERIIQLKLNALETTLEVDFKRFETKQDTTQGIGNAYVDVTYENLDGWLKKTSLEIYFIFKIKEVSYTDVKSVLIINKG